MALSQAQLLALIGTNLASNSNITAVEHRQVAEEIVNAIFDTTLLANKLFPYQVIQLDVTNAYASANLDNTGLGINLWQGLAECNGNNGTRDRSKRTSVGRATSNGTSTNDYTILGNTFGSPDAVVVEHSHGLSQIKKNTNNFGEIGLFDQANGGAQSGLFTDSIGVSGQDKNIQPSIVTIFLMKLP